MDKHKAKKIVEAGLREARCCLTCVHWSIGSGSRSRWGTCKIHKFEHGKHERVHHMPAAPTTVCDQWTKDSVESDVQSFLNLAHQVCEENQGGDQ